ncbi:hypothetical protein P4U23_12095 [Aeribacillus composti]|uniref:hypothetical protein n=1 Tax=Aeribacillus composti TaxID=1868734 RepID=UPI002E206124|nr:hypothetical protein [Aeribacillus composti]
MKVSIRHSFGDWHYKRNLVVIHIMQIQVNFFSRLNHILKKERLNILVGNF